MTLAPTGHVSFRDLGLTEAEDREYVALLNQHQYNLEEARAYVVRMKGYEERDRLLAAEKAESALAHRYLESAARALRPTNTDGLHVLLNDSTPEAPKPRSWALWRRCLRVGEATVEQTLEYFCRKNDGRFGGVEFHRELVAALSSVLREVPEAATRRPSLGDEAFDYYWPRVRPTLMAWHETRRLEDLRLLRAALREQPHLSLEEIRRRLALHRPHLTGSYVDECCKNDLRDALVRPVDRAGPWVNAPWAVHIAYAALKADPQASWTDILAEFLDKHPALLREWPGFDRLALIALHEAYPYIPDPRQARRPSLQSIHHSDVWAYLEAHKDIPPCADLLEQHIALRPQGELANCILISDDHALGDKLAFYRTLLLVDGLTQNNVWLYWTVGTGSPLLRTFVEQVLGIRGQSFADPQQLARGVERGIERALRTRPGTLVLLHLQGVPLWRRADALAGKYGGAVCGTSHTGGDGIDLRGAALKHIFVAVMAQARAKDEREYPLLGISDARLFTTLEADLMYEVGSLRTRRFHIHGALGKRGVAATSGALAATRALFTAGRQGVPPPSSIAVIDPLLSLPENAALRQAVLDMGIDILDTREQQLEELRTRHLVVINNTDAEIWDTEHFANLEHSAITINLGSNNRGFSQVTLRQMAVSCEYAGHLGHATHRKYRLARRPSGHQPFVLAVADNLIANLAVLNPNPPALSSSLNVLIRENLMQAKRHYQRGVRAAQVIESASFEDPAPGEAAPARLMVEPWGEP